MGILGPRMKWKTPLQQGQFLKRYKRFFADVEIDGETVVAHVANTGSLNTVTTNGKMKCLVSPAENPERKLRWSLQAIQSPEKGWIGINTSLPNQLVREAFEGKVFSHWKKFDEHQWEVKINKETRLDFCLTRRKDGLKRYVEVKNVTMREEQAALFPDAVTSRGLKHINELMSLSEVGHEVEILFVVQRVDCEHFNAAEAIDPDYAKALKQAMKKGLVVTAAEVAIDHKGAEFTGRLLELKL